jgi:UV DNA damage endonuclease
MKVGYSRPRSSAVCSARSTPRSSPNELHCLKKALEWNYRRGFLLFRLHPTFLPDGTDQVSSDGIRRIGEWIRERHMRLCLRLDSPDCNTADESAFQAAAGIMLRTALFFDRLGLDETHKIQIRVGVGSGAIARNLGLRRFDQRYRAVPEAVQRRLVMETSGARLGLRDCLVVWAALGIPIVYRSAAVSGEVLEAALARSRPTWTIDDGTPLVDYCTAGATLDALPELRPEADYMFEADGLPAALRNLPTGSDPLD